MNIIIHHNDADGIASAAIVFKFLTENDTTRNDIEFLPMSHGYDFDKTLVDNKDTYIVDFSFENDVMKYIIDSSNSLIIIDHHKTFKEKMPDIWNNEKIQGIREIGTAACELTWKHFYPHIETPIGISMIGDRDVWTWKLKDTEAFNEALYTKLREPLDDIMYSILDNDLEKINELILSGNMILEKKKKTIDKYIKGGKIIMFHGYITCVVNSTNYISDIANGSLKDGNDIGLVWSLNACGLKISLRSVGDLDVSAIAKEYGGGGHKNASGLTITDKNEILEFIKMLL